MFPALIDYGGHGTITDVVQPPADELKIFKPSPRVYRLARTRLKVATGALGFVSSNSWDVSGAASVGLTTFWVQRRVEEPPEGPGFPATHVITSLSNLAAVFR